MECCSIYHFFLTSVTQQNLFRSQPYSSHLFFALLYSILLYGYVSMCLFAYFFLLLNLLCSSVQFSSSVKSNSLRPHEPQHSRPPCPSPTPKVYPNSCLWYHLTISYSVLPFSSCPQSFPALGSFQMSQLFALGGQSIGVSASTSVLPMNT